MTEEPTNNDDNEAVAAPQEPRGGERLADARRSQQITVGEVAKELHLDERKVRALENNEFDILGAPVFAKGHLRKYAQLVGVSIDDVLADYYELNRSTGMPPVVGKVRKPAREISPTPWLGAVVILFVAMAAYWYFAVREPAQSPPPETTDEAAPEVPEPSGVEAADDTLTEVAEDGPVTDSESPVAAGEESDAAPQDTAREQSPPPLVDDEVRLTMRFSGDCWTEITDAGGRRLFFDLGRDGRSVSVSGRAPLSVLFGNADNVSLSVDGEDYVIGAADRRGQTARLTISAR